MSLLKKNLGQGLISRYPKIFENILFQIRNPNIEILNPNIKIPDFSF